MLEFGSSLWLFLQVFRKARTVSEFILKSGPQTNQNWPALLHCDGAIPVESERLEIAVNVNVYPRFLVEAKISKVFKIAER
jgi:hypothetical protein